MIGWNKSEAEAKTSKGSWTGKGDLFSQVFRC